jgi:hypothetical protein
LILSTLLTGQVLFAQKKATKPKTNLVRSAPNRPVAGPVRLHFSGEIVPTEQGDVSTKLAFALASSSGYARHLNALKARSAPFFAVIEAVGYWQFMDETARDMGLSIAPGNDERTDLRKSTEAASRYIKDLYRQLKSWTLVAAAYNGGVGMVQRKIVRSGHRDYYAMRMNPETGYYLYRILAMKELFTNPTYGVGIGSGPAGIMLASAGDAYSQEREQARRMGWVRDDEPEPAGVPVESLYGLTNELSLMDSVLTELLRNKSASASIFMGDVAAKLVRAGGPKIGQSWTFALTEDVQIGEDQLKAGDALYAVVDDVDGQGNLFLRATKVISAQTKSIVPLSLMAINPATGLAGVPRPKVLKAGWVVQWKL